MKKVSIIIPVYNKEKYISECLDSILNQKFDIDSLEVICIDDGSTDDSSKIIEGYIKKYSIIKLYRQKNQGVSSARNSGIEKATGKYILFLDPDDMLSSNTIFDIYTFFESNYAKMDIVTYPIYYFNDKTNHMEAHKRGENIKENTILSIDKYSDFSQTTINICIKNEKNIFFRKDLFLCEDQFFCTELIFRKKCIGFCPTAKYIYRRNIGGASELQHPFHTFDYFIEFHKSLFVLAGTDSSKKRYAENLLLYSLSWRIKQDMVYPYHLPPEEYRKACNSLYSLLDNIDNRSLFNNRWLRNEHKFYLLWLKRKGRPFLILEDKKWWLCDHRGSFVQNNNVSMAIVRERISGNKFTLMGYLKSPMFLFSNHKPNIFMEINNKKESIPLYDSANSKFASKIKVCQFWGFDITFDVAIGDKIKFYVELEGKKYPVSYWFCAWNNINHTTKDFIHYAKPISIEFSNDTLLFKKYEDIKIKHQKKLIALRKKHLGKFLLLKLATLIKKFPIWLYSDFVNTFDNAYFQFKHDIKKKDGIFRFYVYFDDKEKVKNMFTPYERLHLIKFKSFLHRLLFIASTKILTSFSAIDQFVPYTNSFKYYNELIDFETVYLQHGVMHADCDINFAKDRHPFCDKIIASTKFEVDYFKNKLHYNECDIIKTGMPRFEKINHSTKKSNKILWALSWRIYLTTKDGNYWQPRDDFKKSQYFMNTMAILTSQKLKEFLKKKNFHLDVKLHPIFSMYKDYFTIESDNIHLKDVIDEGEYKCLITDFSSFLFDFLYRNTPVIHFIPDEEQVKSGMHIYRSFTRPLTDDGPIIHTDSELILELEKIINSESNQQLSSCFLPHTNSICEDIYQHIVKN